jgi:ethanolamine utilization protein EutJ
MEKVGSIIVHHIQGLGVESITMVGGGSAFLGMESVIQEFSGIPTHVVNNPMLVTPLGLAFHDLAQ